MNLKSNPQNENLIREYASVKRSLQSPEKVKVDKFLIKSVIILNVHILRLHLILNLSNLITNLTNYKN